MAAPGPRYPLLFRLKKPSHALIGRQRQHPGYQMRPHLLMSTYPDLSAAKLIFQSPQRGIGDQARIGAFCLSPLFVPLCFMRRKVNLLAPARIVVNKRRMT